MNVMPPCSISCCKGAIVLNNVYPVYLGDEQVGNIILQKNGLYHKLDCRCFLPGNSIFRLFAVCGDWRSKIGIPAPEGDCYALCTSVRLGDIKADDLRFFVAADEEQFLQQRIPICDDRPCLHMDQLEQMVFDHYDGKPCLRFAHDQNHSLLDT